MMATCIIACVRFLYAQKELRVYLPMQCILSFSWPFPPASCIVTRTQVGMGFLDVG